MQMGKPVRPFWEYIVVALLVGASIFLSLGIYAGKDFLFKSEIVRLELLTMRNYVAAYTLEHHQHPNSIETSFGPRPFKDPFGNPYLYSPKTGQLSSATRACREW